MPILVIFAGLPGVGKTEVARELARQIGALYLRIDSIEQALRNSGAVTNPFNDAGYRVAYAVAFDNLRLGQSVVSDSVNPISMTRDAWLEVAETAGAIAVEVEVKCSDPGEHRRRVETRVPDISGLRPPAWEEVVSREYHPWDREHLVIDSAAWTVNQSVRAIRERFQGSKGSGL